jgi:putative nucleotidyltransferase with HDIG domain
MTQDASSFVKQVGKLPSLPAIYYDLNRAVDDPNSSIASIGGIVRKDQSLTSRLLKLANSAIYSFPSQVDTIEEALQLIGLRQIRDLALVTCVVGAFKHLPTDLVNAPDFWKHSIACGIASGLLAEKRHDPAPERFFTGGLLHDIGRLIMYLKAEKDSVEILRRVEAENLTPCKAETQVLGFDHAELGAELLSLWKLPPSLVEMVRRHHNPAKYNTASGDDATVHYADFIVTALEMGNSGESAISPLSEDACNRCLLDDSEIEPLVEEIDGRCGNLCSILA